MMTRILIMLATVAALIAAPICTSDAAGGEQSQQPNVVVIMVDDMRMDDLVAMPKTRRLLGAGGAGATYTNAYATMPLCCPSRATFLTGQYPHNHGVWDNAGDHGGVLALDDSDTLPVWMQSAGYQTVMIGKYLNGYGVTTGTDGPLDRTYIPPGWDSWAGLTGELKSWTNYRNFDLNQNGTLRHLSDNYQTWDFTARARSQIQNRMPLEQPLFMWLSLLAPHLDQSKQAERGGYHVWSPKPYRGRSTVGVPASDAFNEVKVGDKPSWVRSKPRLDGSDVAEVVQWRRERRDALRAADDSVARVVDQVRATGELDDTVFVFVSDNGYLLGEHRLHGKKRYPYQESARVPLLIRGAGFSGLHNEPVTNVDVPATIAAIAGTGPTTHPLDGLSLLNPTPMNRPVQLEAPKPYGDLPSYSGVMQEGWVYVEYDTGARELYVLAADPWQKWNRVADPTLRSTRTDLAHVLDELRDCVGADCA